MADARAAGWTVQVFDNLVAKANLTERERDVAALVAQGNSVRKIADMLGLSMNTVQGYSKGAYRKLGVHSRQELIDLVNKGNA